MSDEVEKPSEPPPDWAYDWGKVSFNPMEDARAFAMTTAGPSSMSPRVETAAPAPPANTTGWQVQHGLGPQPGIDLIDRMVENATARERAQAQQPDVMQALMMMQQQQNQIIAALAALVARMEDQKKPEKAPAPKGKQP
jgi:hypothetical protein